MSASPGAGRSLQSTSTRRLAEHAGALLALGRQPRPERARNGDRMAAAHAVVGGRDQALGALGRLGHAADRIGRQQRPVTEHDDSGRAGRIERCQPDLQRRGHAALPVVVAHRPRAVQVDRLQERVGVRSEHDHAVAERRCGQGRERPLDERPPVHPRQQLDVAACCAEARACARGEQHAADHPGPRPAASPLRVRAKRPYANTDQSKLRTCPSTTSSARAEAERRRELEAVARHAGRDDQVGAARNLVDHGIAVGREVVEARPRAAPDTARPCPGKRRASSLANVSSIASSAPACPVGRLCGLRSSRPPRPPIR